MTDEEIACGQDNPATTEADWAGAVMKVGNKPVGRTVGRPVSDRPKVATTMRLDADVLATFKASGKGWQSRGGYRRSCPPKIGGLGESSI